MKSVDQWGKDAENRPVWVIFKAAVIGTLVVLVCAALVGLATTGSVFFQSASSNATLGARENIQRNSTNNAVTSITFFHDQCEGYNRQVAIVVSNTARADRLNKRATAEDPIKAQQDQDEAESAQTDADGAFNVLVNTAAAYNAKAANSLNAKFREVGLPQTLPMPTSPDNLSTVSCG